MLMVQSLLIACCLTGAIHQTPHFSITQSSGKTLDSEVKIQIEQLTPLQVIKLEAKAIDQKGEIWTSHAFFQANKDGSIDIDTQKPLQGSSYETTDGMGLFWSMLPPSKDLASSYKCREEQFSVEFTMYQDDKPIANETIHCFLKIPEVQRIEVRENGVVGVLLIPPSEEPLPVIITLSGSNGGLSENRAKLLASNGFAVFALGYFGVDGLPSNLQDIPLEYFETAFAWLKNQSNIDSSHIGLYGVSRGAELSLILGSFFPDSVQAISAIVPSSVVYGGLSETPVNAWLYKGSPILPFAAVPQTEFADGKGRTPENPANTRESFLEGMKDKKAFAAAAIPVENIRCPLLLVSGGDDQMWPSDLYAQQIINRLEEYHSPIVCHHLHYPEAGHGINIPNLPIPGPTYYHPISKLWFSMGGTRAADAKASRDSWKKITSFFQETLKPTEANHMKESNQEKFSALRKFKLPNDQYAITGSGPLGIRNLKAIGDIDIIVTPQLWDALAEMYGIIDENGVKKIAFPDGIVEAFGEDSFYTHPKDDQAPTIASRIAKAKSLMNSHLTPWKMYSIISGKMLEKKT